MKKDFLKKLERIFQNKREGQYLKSLWNAFEEHLIHLESKFDEDIEILKRKHVKAEKMPLKKRGKILDQEN